MEDGGGACAAGVFPLGLGREVEGIAVGEFRGLVGGLHAELLGIKPRDVFDRVVVKAVVV